MDFLYKLPEEYNFYPFMFKSLKYIIHNFLIENNSNKINKKNFNNNNEEEIEDEKKEK